MRIIPISKNAHGYTALIAGHYHWFLEDTDALEYAWRHWPQITFTIKPLNYEIY